MIMFYLTKKQLGKAITAMLTIALLFSVSLTSAAELDKRSFASYEGLSAGAAWDLRYGHGEVEGDYMGIWTIANCEESTSLFREPNDESEVVIIIPKWEDIEAYYYDSEWFECVYKGFKGYVLREFLTDCPGKYVDYPKN